MEQGAKIVCQGNALAELTGACGSLICLTRDDSLWAVGLFLNGEALFNGLKCFAAEKYNNLTSTIAAANIQPALQLALKICIADSRSHFDQRRYVNASGELLACDALVKLNEAKFSATLANPDFSGDIRLRLANLNFTIS